MREPNDIAARLADCKRDGYTFGAGPAIGTTIDFRGLPINGRTRLGPANLTGRRFGRLTAIAPWTRTENAKAAVKWTCECECGAFTEVVSWCLTTGRTQSCGCLKHDTPRQFGREASIARFWARVDKRSEQPCWRWTASLSSDGYGRAQFDGVKTLAHRFAYGLLVGPIPEGLVIDHLCRNRACVNPAHMEPVTAVENNRRGRLAKTHCLRGHPLSGPNLVMYSGARCCRVCVRLRGRRAEAAKRLRREQEQAA